MTEASAGRARVLKRLALERLVTHGPVDIAEGHREHEASLARAERYLVEGLTIDAPEGVYHPHANSTSLMFINNILAKTAREPERVLDVGCGSGVVGLFVARHFGADVLATDLSSAALAATRHNAAQNRVAIRVEKSDLFDAVEERGFDLVVFNTPLVDIAGPTEGDGDVLRDPGGALLERFGNEVGERLAPDGMALFSICSNSAYERLDGIGLQLQTVGIEMTGNGFWRAIIGAKRG